MIREIQRARDRADGLVEDDIATTLSTVCNERLGVLRFAFDQKARPSEMFFQ